MNTFTMYVQAVKEQFNTLLQQRQYQVIYELFRENVELVERENELAIARTMLSICEQEAEAGQRILFEKVNSLEEIVDRYTKLMFYLRRFEFDIMDDNTEAFNRFLELNQVSLQELFGVMYCCTVDKEKVLKILKDKIIRGEVVL